MNTVLKRLQFAVLGIFLAALGSLQARKVTIKNAHATAIEKIQFKKIGQFPVETIKEGIPKEGIPQGGSIVISIFPDNADTNLMVFYKGTERQIMRMAVKKIEKKTNEPVSITFNGPTFGKPNNAQKIVVTYEK